MNQTELKERMKACRDQLKLALWNADAMVSGSVTPEGLSSLWSASGKSHSMVTALKVDASGVKPPKIG